MALTSEEFLVLDELIENLDPIIHDRGIDIFHDDRVSYLGEDTALMIYEFSVIGSGRNVYIVSICLNQEVVKYGKEINVDLASKCSCIYYQKNLSCKHVAAAAYYLDFHSDESFRKSQSHKKVESPKIVKLVPDKVHFHSKSPVEKMSWEIWRSGFPLSIRRRNPKAFRRWSLSITVSAIK